MGNLRKTDFIVALIFGCVIALLCLQLQSSKKSNKGSYKKENQQLSLSSQQDERYSINNYTFNTKYQQKRKPVLKNNRAPSSVVAEEESQYDEYVDPTTEFSDEEAKAQMDRETYPYINRKLENFLYLQLGLSEIEVSNVLDAKRLMEDEMLRNQNRQSIVNPNGEINAELNIIHQQILSNYNEALKQILGPENYQRFSVWQNEQDAAFAESYAGGKPMPIDEI